MERRRIVEPVRLFPGYSCVGQIAVVGSGDSIISRSSELFRVEPLSMARTAAGGCVAIQVRCLVDIEVRVRVFVRRPVVDVEETLIAAKVARRKTNALDRIQAVTGILPVGGQRATDLFPVRCRWWIRTLEPGSRRIERSPFQRVSIGRLGGTDENILQGQRPMTGYCIGFGVAATSYKSQAAALYVGQHAVDHQVPLRSEPDGRKVEMSPIVGRGIVIQDGDHAVRFISRTTNGGYLVVTTIRRWSEGLSGINIGAFGSFPATAGINDGIVLLEHFDLIGRKGRLLWIRILHRWQLRRQIVVDSRQYRELTVVWIVSDDAKTWRRVTDRLKGSHRRRAVVSVEGFQRRSLEAVGQLLSAGLRAPVQSLGSAGDARRPQPVEFPASPSASRHIVAE